MHNNNKISNMNKASFQELITIGIPTYNTPLDFFKILLNQVLNQTYKNIDILIVDDGSGPDFTLYLELIEKEDKRIRVIFNETNKGIYATRNIILKNIKGEYFTFIDSDDYVPADYLEKMYCALKKCGTECSISYCGYVKFKRSIPKISFSNVDLIEENDILFNSLIGQYGHTMCARLIPSFLLEHFEIDSEYGFDDAQLVPLLLKRIKAIAVVKSTKYFYRQRQGSIMHSTNDTLKQVYKTYLEYLKIASTDCLEAVPFLQIMIALSDFKLCCLNDKNKNTKKVVKEKSKALRLLIKKNGYIGTTKEKIQYFLSIHFPYMFAFFFGIKRRKTTKNQD